MKQWLFRIAILGCILPAIAISVAPAAAAGLNLGWAASTAENTCPTSAGSAADKTSTCLANTGAAVAIGSAIAPANLSQVTAEEIVVDVQDTGTASNPGVLSDWWHFDAGSCRGQNGAVTPSLSFTANFDPALDEGACQNYWGTAASGGINFAPGVNGQNRARISAVFAVAGASAGAFTPGSEYYLFRMSIDNRHTVSGAVPVCDGCADGICIVFQSVKFDQPPGTPGGDVTVSGAATRQFVTWQGGSGDCTLVPVHRSTWGRVKSLYR